MKKLTQMIGTFVLVFFGCMVIFTLFPGDEDTAAVMSTATATPDLMQFVNTPTPAPPPSTPPATGAPNTSPKLAIRVTC